MKDTPTTIPDFDLDRICWYIAHGLADFEHRVWLDSIELDDEFVYDDDDEHGPSAEYERGYAHAMYNQYLDFVEQLDTEGVAVFARAQRYADENDTEIRPVWLDDVDTDEDLEIFFHDARGDDEGPGRKITSIPDERLERWENHDGD